MNTLKVYGTDWCEDTQRTRAHLNEVGIPYDYINIDQDEPAREWVKQHNGGKQKTPTVDVYGQILVEPENDRLDEALRARAGTA